MKKSIKITLISMLGMFAFFACYNAETEVIEVEKQVVVEKEVIKEVEVPGETVITEVVKEIEVPVIIENTLIKSSKNFLVDSSSFLEGLLVAVITSPG